LLIVVAVVGIVAGMVVVQFQPSVYEQLKAAGHVVAAELDYARSLAVAGDSNYRTAFDLGENRLVITHVGSDGALDDLPAQPFGVVGNSVQQRITDLDKLPQLGALVQLIAAQAVGSSQTDVTDVEFTPLGGTARPETTFLWLAAGSNRGRRFMPVSIDPVTGMASVGSPTNLRPTGVTDVHQPVN